MSEQRFVASVTALFVVTAGVMHGQPSTSRDAARHLTEALDRSGRTAIAARHPDEPGRFIAALYIPGSQLLVVSARHPSGPAIEYRIANGQHREVYLDLQGTPTPEGKFFVQDESSNGIITTRRNSGGLDVAYEDGARQMIFDGRDQGDTRYDAMLAAADKRYARLLTVLTAALAEPQDAAPTRDAAPTTSAALAEFGRRVDAYMKLRGELVEQVPPQKVTPNPSVIWTRENELASRVQAARTNAKHGDIFTPETRAVFRRLLAGQVAEYGEQLTFTVERDTPAPGAVPLEVNARYPVGAPFPSTPAPVLDVLPRLPRGLEYRIIGKDLILVDQPADVILDYIRNALP